MSQNDLKCFGARVIRELRLGQKPINHILSKIRSLGCIGRMIFTYAERKLKLN